MMAAWRVLGPNVVSLPATLHGPRPERAVRWHPQVLGDADKCCLLVVGRPEVTFIPLLHSSS